MKTQGRTGKIYVLFPGNQGPRYAGDGKLAQGADGIELLVVHRYPDVAILLGDGDHGAGVRRGRVLNKACGQALVEYSIRLLSEDRVDTVGAGEHGGAVRGDGNLEGNM